MYMRRVLFISYDFSPCRNIGGALRSSKFVHFLSGLGWHSYVFAMEEKAYEDNDEYSDNVIRVPSCTPYSKPYEVRPYGWAFSFWKSASRFLEENSVDIIYVTAPPFPQLASAVLLKDKYNLPLVVDFRDAWSLDPYKEGSRLKKFLYGRVFPVVERWVMKNADSIILNTPSTLKAYQNLYPSLSSRMAYLTNGFDENDFSEVNSQYTTRSKEEMHLLYCGRFGILDRKPDLILKAIKKAVNAGIPMKLSFIGNQPESVLDTINTLGLQEDVNIVGQVPHVEAIKAMFQCDVLILYMEPSNFSHQSIAGKTFEYIRTGKPILYIGPEGDNQNLISKYVMNNEVVTSFTVDAVFDAICRMFSCWEAGSMQEIYSVSDEFLSMYSRENLTKALVSIFDKCLSR